MDETVTARALAGMLIALALPAAAQSLPDPTRPPSSILEPVAATPGGPAEPARPQLQSVLLARGAHARRVAVIDGQTVRQGEQFKGYTVASIGENEAVLVRGKEKQVLKLFPSALPASGQR